MEIVISSLILNWFVLYAVCILGLAWSCNQEQKKQSRAQSANGEALHRFSIIIPFRNEEHRLPPLLASLATLDYPQTHVELVFVDDHSEDQSTTLIRTFQKNHPEWSIQLVTSASEGKKAALYTGISQAQMPFIVTTDADCVVLPSWLKTFNAHFQNPGIQLLCGPVRLVADGSWVAAFDRLDFLAQQACSLGAHGLGIPLGCSGANLAFAKAEFHTINGYAGNAHIASGDDVFLLHKMMDKNPAQVAYVTVPTATVSTPANTSWKALLQQRIRWGTKAPAYTHRSSRFLTGFLVLSNLLLALMTLVLLFATALTPSVLIAWILKLGSDVFFVLLAAQVYKQKDVFNSLWWVTPCYPFYISALSLSSLWLPAFWKGRSLTK
ncbi:glycosyltransferase [Croceiramulus getboli]|nr:glycosyltransferase [Flavobacteriaceae bacterium YJPT1-3]